MSSSVEVDVFSLPPPPLTTLCPFLVSLGSFQPRSAELVWKELYGGFNVA